MTMSHRSSPERAAAAILAAVCAASAASAFGCHRAASAAPTPRSAPVRTIAGAGFDEPENLVYDSLSDVYLVSNIGGGGPARDDNGFVSRVAPDGRVLTLTWIAGGRNGVELDSPKGLAIRGDTLAVADIGAVRLFDRRTGRLLRSITLPGLVMNDVAFAPDGSIWVTDTGPDRDKTPVDTTRDLDAVWHVRADGTVRAAARGLWLDRPDGIVVDGRSVLVATFGGRRLERVWAADRNEPTNVEELPAGRLDGLRRLADGSLLLTSWDAGAVWHLWQGDEPRRELIGGLTSPAGVAVDTRRHKLAVTSMQRNELYLLPLE